MRGETVNFLTKSQYRLLIRRGVPQNGSEVFTGISLIREGFLSTFFGMQYITVKGIFAIIQYKRGLRKWSK